MDVEGFEEEESPLEGLVTGKYGITNLCADVRIWDDFWELALDGSEVEIFSFDFWHVVQQEFRKIFMTITFLFIILFGCQRLKQHLVIFLSAEHDM